MGIMEKKNDEKINWREVILNDTLGFMESAYVKGVSLSMLNQRNKSLLSYFDGVTFNPQYIKEIRDKLTTEEFGWVCLLALTVRTPLNVMYDGEFPYNDKGVQGYLGFKNRKQSVDFMKKLIDVGVLLNVKTNQKGRIGRVFVLNPYIVFRGTVIDNQALDLFSEYVPV